MEYQRKGFGLNTEQEKYCTCCEQVKPRTSYYKNKRRHDGIDVYCKECSKAKKKQRNQSREQKDKNNKKSAEWRKKNPEKTMEIAKRYRENNKDKLSERRTSEEGRRYNREYMQARRQDPVFRMRQNVSRQVSHALFRAEGSKHGESVMENLPYNANQLREHLEKQFDEHMTWENYGSYWHIDHIYPHSKLPYDSMQHPNFAKAWALDNLQPLEAGKNISKSNKIIED